MTEKYNGLTTDQLEERAKEVLTVRPNYNPSSSGFLNNGGLAITKYDSGCLRAILAKKNGARTKFPPQLADMGEQFELLSEVYLKKQYPDWVLSREEVLKGPCVGLDEETFSGRKDFTLRKDGETIIVECKSMCSSASRLNVIRKGIMNPSQIAQLISYMIQEKVTKGMMMFGYYEIHPETGLLWCPNAFRDQGTKKANFAVYRVEILDNGTIQINGEDFEYTVLQSIEHRNAVMKVLSDKAVGLRPADATKEYGGPCNYCTFRDVCTSYDASVIQGDPQTADQFIENCIEAANNDVSTGPTFKQPKRTPK
jgi:hypothetical protein